MYARISRTLGTWSRAHRLLESVPARNKLSCARILGILLLSWAMSEARPCPRPQRPFLY